MTWYRSLYWRIAVGFVACLALLLVVQGVLFVWMMSQAGSSVPNQPPDRFARAVAVDVGQALERDAGLDVERYVREEYEGNSQPFFLMLADGRAIGIGAPVPAGLAAEARVRLDNLRRFDPSRLPRGRFPERGGFRGGPPNNRPGGPAFEPPDPAPGSRPFDRAFEQPDRRAGNAQRRLLPALRNGAPGLRGRQAPIIAGGQVAGLVIVPPQPPFSFLLTQYAPTLLTVAVATLVVGAVLATVVIFGPTRRRLKAVEDAARRLGGGDLTARAPEGGRDEVAAVATAFNAMAADLAARTDALVAADRARRQLLADVSHELNTPVTAMRGYLETLAMPELALDAATRGRYLGIVSEETTRLERIIGDLLDLARLEGGGAGLSLEPVRLDELFARVRARHERTALAAHVALRAEIGPGADTIVVDRTRFEQALQNLAANALRYAPAHSSVRLEAVREGPAVIVTVTDEGPGIPEAHLARVFDRFYKAEESRATPASAGGSGLGLSIVKAIVERHGASIDVSSRPGQTVFRITGLPVPRTTAAGPGAHS